MKVTISVSVGELMDKVSILEIKKRKIKDQDKLKHVEFELGQLENIALSFHDNYYEQLVTVNSKLWVVEDSLRVCEWSQDFSDAFVKLARAVYQLNDERAGIKRKINEKYSSDIVEVKSYEQIKP